MHGGLLRPALVGQDKQAKRPQRAPLCGTAAVSTSEFLVSPLRRLQGRLINFKLRNYIGLSKINNSIELKITFFTTCDSHGTTSNYLRGRPDV